MRLFKFIKKFLSNPDNRLVVLALIAWRIWITIFALFGVIFLPLRSPHLFGGGLENYTQNPLFWGWANFDGEHYLRIATGGYQALTQAFFPVYPLTIGYMARFVGEGLVAALLSGIFISNLAFFLALFLLWKLINLDYTTGVARLSVLALLLFPTSFFFGAVYTESLFLLLVIGSFYAARKEKWFLVGLIGGVASATRLAGIFLLPALLVELWYINRKKPRLVNAIALFLIPTGLILYMLFLKISTGDILAFYNLQQLSGEQRSGTLIFLPQVFWRYAKMLLTVTKSDPLYLTILLEAATAVLGIALLTWGYLRKVRLSYLVFAFLGFTAPTLTGSFSSLPRYFLPLFPFFIIVGLFLASRGKKFRVLSLSVSAILLAIETALFIRGYWVA